MCAGILRSTSRPGIPQAAPGCRRSTRRRRACARPSCVYAPGPRWRPAPGAHPACCGRPGHRARPGDPVCCRHRAAAKARSGCAPPQCRRSGPPPSPRRPRSRSGLPISPTSRPSALSENPARDWRLQLDRQRPPKARSQAGRSEAHGQFGFAVAQVVGQEARREKVIALARCRRRRSVGT